MNRRGFVSGLLSLLATPVPRALPAAGGVVKIQAMSLYGTFGAGRYPAILYLNSIYGKMGADASLAARRVWEEARGRPPAGDPIEDFRAMVRAREARR